MSVRDVKADDITAALCSMQNEEQRRILMRFFKTGPGGYGEGDRFLGLKVPQTRLVVRESRLRVELGEIERLLASPWHEVRLAGFLLLAEEMKAALPRRRCAQADAAARREEIARFYLAHARRADNWDLVDLSCPAIVGAWLLHPTPDGRMPDRSVLDRLAASDCLWEQRIAVVSTLALIRERQFDDTLRIVTRLLPHPHDLIHKAMGWMLREAGKRDTETLRAYLAEHAPDMPRTTLRYAIERLNEAERRSWLAVRKR